METQIENSMECDAGDSGDKGTGGAGPSHDAAKEKPQEVLGSGEPPVKANKTTNVAIAGVRKPKRARRAQMIKDFQEVFRELLPRASKSKALIALKNIKTSRKKVEGVRKLREPRAPKLDGVKKRRKKGRTHFTHKKRKSSQPRSFRPKYSRPKTSRPPPSRSATSMVSESSGVSGTSAVSATSVSSGEMFCSCSGCMV